MKFRARSLSIESVLRYLYLKIRGHPLGEDVPFSVISSAAAHSLVCLVRGQVRGGVRTIHSFPHFRGAGSTTINRRYVKIGRGVVFGPRSTVSGFSANGVSIGDRVTLGQGAILQASGVIREPGVGIVIGSDTAVGVGNVIMGQGGVYIGSNVLLGPGVTIISENHVYEDINRPIRLQGPSRSAVVIEDDCWLGSGVTVLAGVTIGHGTVVGAGAVVTKTLPPFSIAVGVPAHVIGARKCE